MRRVSPALAAYAWAVYAFMYLPIAVLVLFSFNASKFGAAWAGFTTRWYGVLFAREDVREAVTNTLTVALPPRWSARCWAPCWAWACGVTPSVAAPHSPSCW